MGQQLKVGRKLAGQPAQLAGLLVARKQHDVGPAVQNLLQQLSSGQHRVQGNMHGTGQHDAQVTDQPVQRVFRHLHDPIARLDTPLDQPQGHLAGPLVQLTPAQFLEFPPHGVEKGDAIRIHSGPLAKEADHRFRRLLNVHTVILVRTGDGDGWRASKNGQQTGKSERFPAGPILTVRRTDFRELGRSRRRASQEKGRGGKRRSSGPAGSGPTPPARKWWQSPAPRRCTSSPRRIEPAGRSCCGSTWWQSALHWHPGGVRSRSPPRVH